MAFDVSGRNIVWFYPTVHSVVLVKLTSETGNRRLSPHYKPNLFKDLIGIGKRKDIHFINE